MDVSLHDQHGKVFEREMEIVVSFLERDPYVKMVIVAFFHESALYVELAIVASFHEKALYVEFSLFLSEVLLTAPFLILVHLQ